MLKLTSLAIGLLSIIAMAPRAEAMTANARPISIDSPQANLHSQVILRIGERGYSRGNYQRRRELELQREREAARRRQARERRQYRRGR